MFSVCTFPSLRRVWNLLCGRGDWFLMGFIIFVFVTITLQKWKTTGWRDALVLLWQRFPGLSHPPCESVPMPCHSSSRGSKALSWQLCSYTSCAHTCIQTYIQVNKNDINLKNEVGNKRGRLYFPIVWKAGVLSISSHVRWSVSLQGRSPDAESLRREFVKPRGKAA